MASVVVGVTEVVVVMRVVELVVSVVGGVVIASDWGLLSVATGFYSGL